MKIVALSALLYVAISFLGCSSPAVDALCARTDDEVITDHNLLCAATGARTRLCQLTDQQVIASHWLACHAKSLMRDATN